MAGASLTVNIEGLNYCLPNKTKEHLTEDTSCILMSFIPKQPVAVGPPMKVSVVPRKGANLTARDHHLNRISSDPYILLFYRNKVHSSEITLNNLNPVFQCTPFLLGSITPDDNSVLELQCWDHDRITHDDFMGGARIILAGLLAQLNFKTGHFILKPTNTLLYS